jgi:predicted transcriptional regulator
LKSLCTTKEVDKMEEAEIQQKAEKIRLVSKEFKSRESVMILTILDNNRNLTLSDICTKVGANTRIVRSKLNGLLQYSLIEEKDNTYAITEGGTKVLDILFEISEILQNSMIKSK